MLLDRLLFKDPSTGKASITMTSFFLGFLVVNAKLILSGVTIGGVVCSAFTGVDYCSALGALGAIYVARKATTPSTAKAPAEPDKKDDDQ